MAITLVHCPVIGSTVTRVTDLEDRTMKIICAEYEEPTAVCRLKREARQGGRLSQLLERAAEHTLETRDTRCQFR